MSKYFKTLLHTLLYGKPTCYLVYYEELGDDCSDFCLDATSDVLGDKDCIGYIRGYNIQHMGDLQKDLKRAYPFHNYVLREGADEIVMDFTQPLFMQGKNK